MLMSMRHCCDTTVSHLCDTMLFILLYFFYFLLFYFIYLSLVITNKFPVRISGLYMDPEPPPPMKFDKRSNVVAYLNDKDPKSAGFRDVISWMKASPISFAVTKDLVIDQQHIRDFWESATYNLNANPTEIRARVMGEEIVLTVDSIARMLRLERDVGIPSLLSITDVYEGFLEMGYEGTDYLERREIKKTFLSREWRFIAHVIILCLDHRKGGTDGLNFEWARAMLNLCRGDKANIPQMIFEYMIENISAAKKDKWLLYPRFIQNFY